METIKITYKNKSYVLPYFSTPLDLIEKYKLQVEVPVAAVVNGHLTRLNKHIQVDSTIELIELKTPHGKRIYESSVLFLFLAAFKKRFPDYNVFIQHSIHQGIFAEIKEKELTPAQIKLIEKTMREMVDMTMPIEKVPVDWEVYMNKMRNEDRTDMINLLKYSPYSLIKVYKLDELEENLYLPLVPTTGYIKVFSLRKYQKGIAILYPNYVRTDKITKFCPHPKLFNTYKENYEWSRILKIRTVGHLNKYIMNEDIGTLVKVTEALHEKKVAHIADQIVKRKILPRLIMIAGPSSSGKTTFAKRLDIQLKVNGINATTLSIDNYFVEREKTPKDKNGNYDFESLEAIDVKLFRKHISELLKNKEVEIPRFDFRIGRRRPKGQGTKMKLEENQVIIIEGIHGLNPKLTEGIPSKDKFKIYVSALTQLNLHRHDRVPTTDTRLIRRIVRDGLFRGYSASDTLAQWPSVREGEEKYIFPFQEEADVIFNSALFYELSVLKSRAEQELLKVERSHPMYAESRRLLRFLSYFLPLSPDEVPSTSILKEFIGNSSFSY